MVLPRPDLDGLRLIGPDNPDVWLIVRGERRHVTSSEVYDSLWTEVSGLVAYEGLEWITRGPDLGHGTCLVRAEGSLSIHLLTRAEGGTVLRHFIPTYESFLDFGFDEGKVRNLPFLVVQGLEEGIELTSAADRAGRQ